MMKIHDVSGTNMQTNQIGGAQDSVSKNIQRQIAEAQKQLQELSSNKEMSAEEKMKKRQEIQKKIADLNALLRQHQIEARKEKQQSKEMSMDNFLGGKRATKNGQSAGFSETGMKAMISADTAVNQAKAQGSVKTAMEGHANVLKSEIELSRAHGGAVEAKEGELSDIEQRVTDATSSQISHLAEAEKELEKAADDHSKVEDDDTKEKKRKENTTQESERIESSFTSESDAQPVLNYTSVDVLL